MRTTLSLILTAFALAAAAQTRTPVTPLERQGLIFNTGAGQEKKKSAEQQALDKIEADKAAKAEEQRRVQEALDNPANYRMIRGKLCNVALAETWRPLIEPGERGIFLQSTPDGMAFEIEKLRGNDWVYHHTIIVTNYPSLAKVAGAKLTKVSAMRVGMSERFTPPVAVFDCGVLPHPPRAVLTNAPVWQNPKRAKN